MLSNKPYLTTFTFVSLLILLALAACGTSDREEALIQTEVALAIRETQLAQPPTLAPTDTPAAPIATSPPVATNTPAPAAKPSFETWASSAEVLLYEDMTGDRRVSRIILNAFEELEEDFGFSVKLTDVRDEGGTLRDKLIGGASGGSAWDLVIIASERRTAITGEFFDYLEDVLDDGSAVILEVWNLDRYYQGKIAGILQECGVAFETDWHDRPTKEQLLFPINDDKILHTPNDGLRLTSMTRYWAGLDLGDFLEITNTGDASIILSNYINTKDTRGLLTICMDRQLLIQSYSTHSYEYGRILPLWENMIYNMLEDRYNSLP